MEPQHPANRTNVVLKCANNFRIRAQLIKHIVYLIQHQSVHNLSSLKYAYGVPQKSDIVLVQRCDSAHFLFAGIETGAQISPVYHIIPDIVLQ